jgi:release factor glutamine methyltransferase
MSEGGTWTVRRILEWTSGFFKRKNVEPARLSAELILAHILGVARIKLYTDYERVLSEKDLAACRELVRRAGDQEPIAYLTGTAPFFNMEFAVTRDVLIPRPDTETLVENVLQFVRHQGGFESPRVLDLCTGSGCIGAAIAHHLKTAVVTATDISPAAVAVARKNIERLGLNGRVLVEEGDLFSALEKMVDVQPFDLIVANPPYIPTGQMEGLDRSVKEYEPVSALDGGLDGLVLHRRILADAPARLVTGGRIYMEIAFDQGELATQVMGEYPAFDEVRILKDYGGRDRVLTGRRK